MRAESMRRQPIEPGLQGAGLDRGQYQRLLTWWVANGTQPCDTDAARFWRNDFVRKLSDPSYTWRELIQCDLKRRGGASKTEIKVRLSEARDDPLLFLNLGNVSPYRVLHTLDYWKAIIDTLKGLKEKGRSKTTLCADIAALNKAARIIDAYQPLLTCYLDWVDYWKSWQADGKQITLRFVDIQGAVADSRAVKNVVSIIKTANEIDLLAIGEKKRGGSSKVELSYLVWHLEAMLLGRKTKGQPRRRVCWGAIASLILAAYPPLLGNCKDQDPEKLVRNVKNARSRPAHERLLPTPAGAIRAR